MSDQDKSQKFKVKDNRRFTEDGSERASEVSTKIATQNESPQVEEHVEQATPDQGENGIDFSSFIISLATQALMHLGAVPPPDGVSLPIDLTAAKQTIDIIAMLQKKTQANLDSTETRMMEEILHNLRIAFVERSRAAR